VLGVVVLLLQFSGFWLLNGLIYISFLPHFSLLVSHRVDASKIYVLRFPNEPDKVFCHCW
jgi:hypothetical protein